MEKRRSDIANEITNIVVACDRNFGHLSKATTVNKLPENENAMLVLLLFIYVSILLRTTRQMTSGNIGTTINIY